jgi:hypothetical protein
MKRFSVGREEQYERGIHAGSIIAMRDGIPRYPQYNFRPAGHRELHELTQPVRHQHHPAFSPPSRLVARLGPPAP